MKQSKIVTQQPKLLENSNTDLKSVATEHPKTSHNLPKAIKQAEIVGSSLSSTTSLYSETTEHEKKIDGKNAKITKLSHAYKSYAVTYKVEILNSLNPKLKLKNKICNKRYLDIRYKRYEIFKSC